MPKQPDTDKTPSGQILRVKLADTDVHPLLEKVAMLSDGIGYLEENRDADESELNQRRLEENALRESIRRDGICTPILGVRNGDRWLIIQGRHRRKYGLETGREDAPLIEVGESEARAIVFRENALIRSQTKSQIAWLAVLLRPEVAANKRGAHTDPLGMSAADLAAEAGVSSDYINWACRIYRVVKKSDKARKKVEGQLAGGIGLGEIVRDPLFSDKGDESGSGSNTGGANKATTLSSFSKTLGTLKTQCADIAGWNEEQRETAFAAAAQFLRENAAARDFWASAMEASSAAAAE